MTYAFLALAIAQLGALVTVAVWYHQANTKAENLRDLRDAERKVSAEYQHQRDVATAERDTALTLEEQEHTLRTIAEMQRNEAQAKCREYLRTNLRGATDDEIRAVVSDLFTSPLAVVPRPPGVRSPKAEAGDAGPDDILDPFARVQPTAVP